jgi:hypothetical protein
VQDPATPAASTSEASAALAQSRGLDAAPSPDAPPPPADPPWQTCIDAAFYRTLYARPYERRRGDPLFRPLSIYALDPSASHGEGGVARVNVPYEPLAVGPKGHLFEVDETFETADGLRLQRVDLDAPRVLLESGRRPSPSDPQFHQQMVYAVAMLVYAVFRKALGRNVAWGFDGEGEGPVRLRLLPHVEGRNAYYDARRRALCFGYFRNAAEARGRNVPGGFTFTCLSHDVVAHEVTHALLDGLRARFTRPSNPDVLAFHEALGDLVALFQRFTYPEVVRGALREARGEPGASAVLTSLARQMAQAAGEAHDGVRSAVTAEGDVRRYDEASQEPHALGQVLVEAVFDAFLAVFRRKSARLLRLCTGGTGVLPEGDLPPDLIDALADKATSLAEQFLTICIRAVDYCPPVDLRFGEFLRAVLTADYDLVPDDPWGYREAWIDAFQKRGIYPHGVASLSEDALLWRPPPPGTPPVAGLVFGDLALAASLQDPAARERLRTEMEAQAEAFVAYLQAPGRLRTLGLAEPGPDADGTTHPPCIHSIRPSRRVGPDGQLILDLVAEVTQHRTVTDGPAGIPMDVYGGATLILGPGGRIRYVISKDPTSARRLRRQSAFVGAEEPRAAGKRFWEVSEEDGRREHRPASSLFHLVHEARPTGSG